MAQVKAKGTKLQTGNTADHTTATTWTDLARVKSIKPPKRKSKEIDTTVLESEAMERLQGLPDVGEAEAVIEYDETRAGTIDGLFNTMKAYRILYPDGSGRMWTGWLSEDGEEEVQQDDLIRMAVKITATGNYEPFEAA